MTDKLVLTHSIEVPSDLEDKLTMTTIIRSPKYLKGQDYILVFSSALAEIAKDKELIGQDLRVLLFIMSQLSFENKLDISQGTIGKELDIGSADVNKSIKKLVSKGFIRLVGTIGRQNIYEFNPFLAFKSKAKNLEKLQDNWTIQNSDHAV